MSHLLVIQPNIRPRQIELLLFDVAHGLEDIGIKEEERDCGTGRYTASQDIFKQMKVS
jgi:hypothetical protein